MKVYLVAILTIELITEICGSGMIALSTDDTSTFKSEDEKDNVKKAAHIKIASTNLGGKSDSSPSDKNRVVRTDKPIELQDPAKHASDEWLLKFYLEQYTLSKDNVKDQVTILENLEYFSHKFDNGKDLFQGTDALKTILLPSLNSSHMSVRLAACAVFAVAAQNNEVVQRLSLENGVIRRLVHLLTFDFDNPVRSKALFALSSLLRNYPKAQEKFISDGGIAALVKVSFLPETRKKCLILVTDMLRERRFCRSDQLSLMGGKTAKEENSKGGEESLEEKCDPEMKLENSLSQNEWCDVLTDSVKNIKKFGLDDQIPIIEATEESLHICSSNLSPFTKIFQMLKLNEFNDEDFKETVSSLDIIITTLSPGIRDEL